MKKVKFLKNKKGVNVSEIEVFANQNETSSENQSLLTPYVQDNFSEQSLSDSEIVNHVLRNPDNFKIIIQLYSERLSHYIKRLLGKNIPDIEHVLQDIFIKVYQNINDYDSAKSLTTWIYRIAHNTSIDYYRKIISKHNISLDVEDAEGITMAEKLVHEDDIISHIDSRARGIVIKQYLNSLDPKYRSVLVLRYLEDKSYEEIGDILKLRVGTVGSLVTRAKKILANQLKHIIIIDKS
jgi:RNA polymerase sigma-70 factor, ECF subfamily